MKVKISPIRKVEQPTHNQIIRKQMNSMKVGEAFDITFDSKEVVGQIRQAIGYYSKSDGATVKTRIKGNTLTVERIRK